MAFQTFGRMKSRVEQLTWAKQRALICVDTGLRLRRGGLALDLAENPDQRRRVQRSLICGYSGDGRGARPGLASADRVDRELH